MSSQTKLIWPFWCSMSAWGRHLCCNLHMQAGVYSLGTKQNQTEANGTKRGGTSLDLSNRNTCFSPNCLQRFGLMITPQVNALLFNLSTLGAVISAPRVKQHLNVAHVALVTFLGVWDVKRCIHDPFTGPCALTAQWLKPSGLVGNPRSKS